MEPNGMPQGQPKVVGQILLDVFDNGQTRIRGTIKELPAVAGILHNALGGCLQKLLAAPQPKVIVPEPIVNRMQ